MDQSVKELLYNGFFSRCYLVLVWQLGVEEGFFLLMESIVVGDLVYFLMEGFILMFQKLRGVGVYFIDMFLFLEDEDVLDLIQDGLLMFYSR